MRIQAKDDRQTNDRRQLQRVVKKSYRHLGTLSSLLQQSLHLASQRHCKQSMNTVVVELMCDNMHGHCLLLPFLPLLHRYTLLHLGRINAVVLLHHHRLSSYEKVP